MKDILNMKFSEDNLPDFGSIEFDRWGENLHLAGVDVDKLNDILTRETCIGTYNAGTFYFQSGDIAIVDDTQRFFVYNSYLDCWTEWNVATASTESEAET
jgi:hypothetical protein